MFRQKSKRRSIVLVEVLITIALMALLTTMSVPRIGGVLDRPKDLEVTRDFKQYTDAAIALQASSKSLTGDNLNNYLDRTLQFSTDKSYSKNPYGEEYRYTPISNGFKIESDKIKNGEVVSTRVLTITRNTNGQLDITDTTTNPTTKPPVSYPDPPLNVSEYYIFKDIVGGYKVSLNPKFKAALDTEANYEEWKVGDPLPNPGSMHEGRPVISMASMFADSQATTLNLSSFDTSNVKNMANMFQESQATTLNLSSFDTSNVTNMAYMFYYSQATTLNLSSFETSNVTTMTYMFSDSQSTTLDLSSFNTSNVTNMYAMFHNSKAVTLDLSSFDTSNVTNMEHMFAWAKAIKIDLSRFNTSNVTTMANMFSDSQSTTLDLSSFDTSNVTNMYAMFYNSQATTLDLSIFNTSNVTTMERMFSYSMATTLDLSSFNTSNVTTMERMFNRSKATTGYAKTQNDANKLNSSSNKPSKLNFVVK